MSDRLYSFVFKGLLSEEALDKAGRKQRAHYTAEDEAKISAALAIEEIDSDLFLRAKRMSIVYAAVAAFENSVRAFIGSKLLEEIGEDWWVAAVDEGIRKKADGRMAEEKKSDGIRQEGILRLITQR